MSFVRKHLVRNNVQTVFYRAVYLPIVLTLQIMAHLQASTQPTYYFGNIMFRKYPLRTDANIIAYNYELLGTIIFAHSSLLEGVSKASWGYLMPQSLWWHELIQRY